MRSHLCHDMPAELRFFFFQSCVFSTLRIVMPLRLPFRRATLTVGQCSWCHPCINGVQFRALLKGLKHVLHRAARMPAIELKLYSLVS